MRMLFPPWINRYTYRLSGMDIDTSALEGAFQIDGSQLDLSGIMNIDLEKILPEVSEDLKQKAEDLGKRLDLEISEEELRAMTEDMIRGFQESLPEDSDIEIHRSCPELPGLSGNREAKNILEESIRNLISSNISVSVPTDQLWGIAAQLVTDYQNMQRKIILKNPVLQRSSLIFSSRRYSRI